MAGQNRDTMEELEDGELSGSNSDSEMGTHVDSRGQVIVLPSQCLGNSLMISAEDPVTWQVEHFASVTLARLLDKELFWLA